MRNTLRKSAKRLFLMAVVAVSLGATTVAVYASTIYYNGTDTNGSTHWTSCGGSAGPTMWKCPPQGGPCEDITDYRAEQFCNLTVQ